MSSQVVKDTAKVAVNLRRAAAAARRLQFPAGNSGGRPAAPPADPRIALRRMGL